MKRPAKEAIAALERHGYEFDRVNSKSFHVYIRDGHEIQVSPGCSENASRQIIRDLERANGTAAKPNKRNAAEIKARQAAEREALKAEIERHRADLARITAERARQLGGYASVMSDNEIVRVQALIEKRERELRHLEALMTGTPLNNRARHRA